MPVTLAQANATKVNKIDQMLVDTFRRASHLLDSLTFDDAVSPGTGGTTLTYGYTRLKTASYAATRAINSEFTAGEAERQAVTTNLAVLGGKYQVDRVIQRASGNLNEIGFQADQKMKATVNQFHNLVINGDKSSDANAFDGLNKILVGQPTEKNTSAVIDLSTGALITSNYKALLFAIDDWLSEFDGRPDALLLNSKMKLVMQAVAREAGYKSAVEDAFGNKIDAYDGIPLIDLGWYASNNAGATQTTPVSQIVNRTVGTAQTGLTDMYAVQLGLDAFHGISMIGDSIVNQYLPDLTLPGAVKDGEIEMVAGVALKNTRKAGVLRNIKVQ
ncbi:major capsid protein [Gottfriedia acidiceleris]|uniref:major capsid protein n=1 Tax=Gottfriedia acidiceleris TaxID=371036 RepID=UPI00300099BD